jgi:hypothetical protein
MGRSSRRWTEDDGTPQRGQDVLDAIAVNAKSTYACVPMTADLSWQSVYSWLSCGTEGVERAFSGTTESTPEENSCWNDSTRGQVVSTHTKLGDHHGRPVFSALDPWSRISEDGRLKIGKKSARYGIGKL